MIILIPIVFDVFYREAHALGRILLEKDLYKVDAGGRHVVGEDDILCRCDLVEDLIVLVAHPRRSTRLQLIANNADGPKIGEGTTDAVVTNHLRTQKVPCTNERASLLSSNWLLRFVPRLLIGLLFGLAEHLREEWIIALIVRNHVYDFQVRRHRFLVRVGGFRVRLVHCQVILREVELRKLFKCWLVKLFGLAKITNLYPIDTVKQHILRFHVSVTVELLMNGSNTN